MTTEKVNVGDRVLYYPTGAENTSVGQVVEILTSAGDGGGRHVKASPEEPRYVIKNEHTGKEAGYGRENIIQFVEADDDNEDDEDIVASVDEPEPDQEYNPEEEDPEEMAADMAEELLMDEEEGDEEVLAQDLSLKPKEEKE